MTDDPVRRIAEEAEREVEYVVSHPSADVDLHDAVRDIIERAIRRALAGCNKEVATYLDRIEPTVESLLRTVRTIRFPEREG